MTLREQLEDRLWKVSGEMSDLLYANTLERLADECIRQMEWARNQGEQEMFRADTLPFVRDPLTLAPEDWKP